MSEWLWWLTHLLTCTQSISLSSGCILWQRMGSSAHLLLGSICGQPILGTVWLLNSRFDLAGRLMALILTFLPRYNPSNVLLSKNLSNFQRPFQVNSLSGGVRHYEASTNKWIANWFYRIILSRNFELSLKNKKPVAKVQGDRFLMTMRPKRLEIHYDA